MPVESLGLHELRHHRHREGPETQHALGRDHLLDLGAPIRSVASAAADIYFLAQRRTDDSSAIPGDPATIVCADIHLNVLNNSYDRMYL